MAKSELCVATDCSKPSRAGKLNLCSMHEARLKRHGSIDICLKRKGKHRPIIIGETFGRLTVLSEAEKLKHERRWKLVCECGETIFRVSYQLRSGESRDCGCERRREPISIGRKFGKLVVIGPPIPHPKRWKVPCRCECGRETSPCQRELLNGNCQSCGRCRKLTAAQKQAISVRNRTHGMSRSPEYASWMGMKMRCTNPNDDRYADYGGRGIKVAPEWLNSFETFLADLGPKPAPNFSLDRVDVDGNYEPNNVRWADASTQTKNRRPFLIRPGISQKARPGTLPTAFIPPPPQPTNAHPNRRHGMTKSPEYQAWSSMKKRCLDPGHPAYRNYGGRGVTVWEGWIDDFAAFLGEIGMRPPGRYSLDRIDNTKGYEPGNVRWADSFTQNRNRRPFLMAPKAA